jgi:uncharacterized protein involved in exopolysaccharide biosynthesis
VFTAIVAAVVVGTLAMPKQYQTRMKVLVKNERADMIVSPDRNGASGYRSEVSENQINSEIELLNSKNLLQRVAVKTGLQTRQHASSPEAAVEKAVARLAKDLNVSPVRKANIILVEYADTDPRVAVAVLATLADIYLEEHLKVHGTPGTYEFCKTQASRYKRELDDTEGRLADFRRAQNIVMLPQQKQVVLEKAAESASALMQAEAAITEYAHRLEGIRRQLEATQARVVTQTRTSTNQYSVERLQTMVAELHNRRLTDEAVLGEVPKEHRLLLADLVRIRLLSATFAVSALALALGLIHHDVWPGGCQRGVGCSSTRTASITPFRKTCV